MIRCFTQPWKAIGLAEHFFLLLGRYREAGEAFDRTYVL